jgi:predicted amidophosphoribosyltransferase
MVGPMSLLRRACHICGRPGEPLCSLCGRRLVPPPSTRVRGVGRVPALFAYEGVGAAVVQALKFRDGRRLVTPLADALAERVVRHDELVCTWLPTSGRRRRARGFDQSELLARAVARRLGVPAVPVLRRRPGPSQTGRNRTDRDGNVEFVLRSRPTGPLVVVDDVCTTGATLRAAAEALVAAGCGPAQYLTVARTP